MTSDDLLVPGLLGLAVLVLAVFLVVALHALRRERAAAQEALADTRADADRLRERVDALARQLDVRTTPEEYVITDIGREEPEDEPAQVAERIDGRLFVDLVVRESVVKAAGLTHGLRRALAPETRNRIRFVMKQEVKRSRKARRIELRDVRREMAARRAGRTAAEDVA